jgi:two-component SAPR family response regulator
MNIKRTLKTLIVDDERLARKALHTLLDEIGMVEVIGEADSVASAMAVISVQKPDLIFWIFKCRTIGI